MVVAGAVVAVAAAATTVGATAAMTDSIDPGLPLPGSIGASAAERLAALRKPTEKRRKPAHTSKIFAAGVSTTALFGMVAAMGWPTATQAAQSAPLPTTSAAPTVPVAAATTTPAPVPTTATVPATAAPVPTDPTVPMVPATAAAVEIPVATP